MFLVDRSPMEYARQQETARIKHLSSRAGLVLWLFVLCQIPLVLIDILLGITLSNGREFSLTLWLESQNVPASIGWSMIEYLVILGIPLLIGLILCRKERIVPVTAERVPASRAVAFLLAGLGVCVFANFIASWSVEFWAVFGVQDPAVETAHDGSAVSLLLSLLSTAVLPALIEEMLFRGVLLQMLRPAGDLNALILSSVLFGVTHGTVSQIPFAAIIGLACGYLVLKTGNLYLAMLLHFLNNAIATILDFLTWDLPDVQASAWIYLAFGGMALLGLSGWLFLRHRSRGSLAPVSDGASSWLTQAERARAVWLSPPVLIYAVFMLLTPLLNSDLFRSAMSLFLFGLGGPSYG